MPVLFGRPGEKRYIMARSRGPQAPTKKHRARLEREKRQQRIIIFGTIVVVVIVVGLVLYGIIQSQYLKPRQAVARVNAATIIAKDFIERTRFERNSLVQQALSNYQTLQLVGDRESDVALSLINNIQQIRFQLDPTSFGRDVLNSMIDDVLIEEEANNQGITVSDEDVQKEIESQFGYFPQGLPPTPTSFPTARPTSTLSPEQLALVTPIPTLTDFPTPTPDSEATPTQIPSATPTLAPTSSPTPYTEDAYQQNFSDTMQQFEDELGISETAIRKFIKAQLYRQKLAEVIGADVELSELQVWARHILVDDEETAQQIIDQLNNGADWNSLAAEFSTDESNKDRGGDLGWFSSGTMVPEFEKVAFNLAIGNISEPVETQFGWHIIQVLGKEERSISEFQYQQAVDTAVQTWLTNIRETADIEIFDNWTEVAPTEPSIPDQLLQELGL